MKSLNKLSLINSVLEKDLNMSFEITIPSKKTKERHLSFIKDGEKEDYLLESKTNFEKKELFKLLDQFSKNREIITMKTTLDNGAYYLELKDGHRASIYLNNLKAETAAGVRSYINKLNRIKKGKEPSREEAFVTVNVLFVVSILSILLVSMMVLAR